MSTNLDVSLAQKFKKESEESLIIRIWTPNNDKDFPATRTLKILVVKTFTSGDRIPVSFGFEPFTEDRIFVCEAQFKSMQSWFCISDPNFRFVSSEELGTILAEMPSILSDKTDCFMYCNDRGILQSKERLVPFLALVLLEQKLAGIPIEKKGANLAFALWILLETLNKTNGKNWQTIYSLIG